MLDDFTEKIHVRIVKALELSPVSGAPVILSLQMKQKNNYIVGPKISDQHGIVVFDRDEIGKWIQLEQKHFPMDYADIVDNCGSLQVEVLGQSEVGQLIQARDMWGAAIPDFKLSDRLRNELLAWENLIASKASSTVDIADLTKDVVIEIHLDTA